MKVLRASLLGLIGIQLLGIGWLRFIRPPATPLPKLNYDYRTTEVVQKLDGILESVDARTSEGLNQLSFFLRLYGYFPEADYCFREATSRNKPSGDTLYLWGTCLEQMGELETAREKFQDALDAGTANNGYVWAALAMLNLRIDDLPAAGRAFDKSRDIDYARPFHVRYLLRVGAVEEAQKLVNEGLRAHPQSIELRQLKARVERELGNENLAATYDDLSRRGQYVMELADPAKNATDRIDEMMGQSFAVRQAIELEKQERYAEALAIMRQSVDEQYWESRVSFLADLEVRAGDPTAAIHVVESAIERGGESDVLLRIMGDAFIELDDMAEAGDHWLRAVELRHNYKIYHRLSVLYAKVEDEQKALECEGMKSFLVGRDALLNEDFDTAVQSLKLSTQQAPSFPHSWFYLGEAFRLSGDPAEAEKAYKTCAELAPNHGRALRAIGK